jgi:hypothetical protein
VGVAFLLAGLVVRAAAHLRLCCLRAVASASLSSSV